MMAIKDFDKNPIDIEIIFKHAFGFKAFSKKSIKKYRDEAEIEWKKDPNNQPQEVSNQTNNNANGKTDNKNNEDDDEDFVIV